MMYGAAAGHSSPYSKSSMHSGHAINTQPGFMDSQVISWKVAKYNPYDGHIDEEVHMNLDWTGNIQRATLRTNPGNLKNKDFFE